MVLEVTEVPSSHCKKCVTALPSSIPHHRMIHHTSGMIVVTSFVPNNIYYTEYSTKEMFICCMILSRYDFIQFIKKYYLCFNNEKL